MKVVATFLAVSLFAGAAHAQCPAFTFALNYPAGATPRWVTIADLDGDGRPDLVVANQSSDSVSVLLGKPDGTFAAAVNYVESGTSPLSVAAGDVNGDGKVDLVIGDCNSNLLSVRFGSSNGTFSGPAHIGNLGGQCPFPVKLADLSGDGKLDIVYIVGTSVGVFIGNGQGAFGLPTLYPAGASPASIAVADFNGDGKNDLAVGNGSGTNVSVLINNGNGTFAPAVSYPTDGHEVRTVIAADFNGDGKIDLAAGNGGDNTVATLLGNGNGTFGNPRLATVAGSPWSLAATDFNGDGRLDLIAVNVFRDITLLPGNGDGSFQPRSDFLAGESPRDIAVADFNGDAKPDLAVANGDVGNPQSAKNYVSILLNKCARPRRQAVKH